MYLATHCLGSVENISDSFCLLQFTINVSTDMRHQRVRLEFQDSPILRGKRLRREHGVQVVLDPVHSVRLMDWWHPQFPVAFKTSHDPENED